jgi:hypothetical protein
LSHHSTSLISSQNNSIVTHIASISLLTIWILSTLCSRSLNLKHYIEAVNMT